MVSSANKEILTLELPSWRPTYRLLALKALAKHSIQRTNKVGERGSPCRTPLCTANESDKKLLLVSQQTGWAYNVFIQCKMDNPNPYFSSTW